MQTPVRLWNSNSEESARATLHWRTSSRYASKYSSGQREIVGKEATTESIKEVRQTVKAEQPSLGECSFHEDGLPRCVSSSDTVSTVTVKNKAAIFSSSRRSTTSQTSQKLSTLHQQSFSTQAGLGNMEDLTARTGKTSLMDSAVSTKSSNPPLATNTTPIPPPQTPNQSELQQKKEKKAKAPKQASTPTALPLSPALIDLRVGHILRCVPHENADSLYVSTIAMGDSEGTDNTQKDEETGRIVRTVCSGLRGLIPLEEMQDRKVIVMANLKPVTMRGIKSTAMVLAASPPPKEGEDAHAADRVVELVAPPEGSEGGDKVYFEGWEYGEGKGPEKVLNPKKKQWEGVQPGLYTTEDLTVMFDAGRVQGVAGGTGELVTEGGKRKCKVPTLKGARLS
jgi:tRNA-binding EMAP/Myf-like protein